MPSEVKRTDRIAPRMLREIADILRDDVKDPRVRDVIVTRVEVSGDLSLARVFFRLLEGGADPSKVDAATRGVESAAKTVRRAVAQRMTLQRAPEIRFRYDAGQDARARVDELLEEIRKDDAARPQE